MGALRGKTVLVTRAPQQGEGLCRLLEGRGAKVIALPVIQIIPIAADIPDPRAYDMVLLTSQNAVERFIALASVSGVRFACVGAKTAEALARHGPETHLVPEVHRSEALVPVLARAFGELRGKRFLLPTVAEGREVLSELLEGQGAAVDIVPVYRIAPAEPPSAPLLPADVFTFLSGKTLECFLQIVADARAKLERARVAVIGPVAREAAERLGIRVDVVPSEATIEALVDALDQA